MFTILEVIFGKVAMNKIRQKIGATKRNPITQMLVQIKDSYMEEFNSREELGRFVLIMIPVMNLFILSGFLPFLITAFVDFCLIRYLINRK